VRLTGTEAARAPDGPPASLHARAPTSHFNFALKPGFVAEGHAELILRPSAVPVAITRRRR